MYDFYTLWPWIMAEALLLLVWALTGMDILIAFLGIVSLTLLGIGYVLTGWYGWKVATFSTAIVLIWWMFIFAPARQEDRQWHR